MDQPQFLGFEMGESRGTDIVILPVPFQGTASYQKGMDSGPAAIIEASNFLETYDEELDTVLLKRHGILTLNAVTVKEQPEEVVGQVYEIAKKMLDEGKFLVVIGGEHSITPGFVKSIAEKYQEFSILHLDAHTDLREEYDGTKWSHACSLKRGREYTKSTVAVGIRSQCQEEVDLIKKEKIPVFYAKDSMGNDEWMKKAIFHLKEKVFITIDVDIFDPSIMPSTGTPEPGGMGWYQVLRFLRKVFAEREVVGFDVVELMPIEGLKAPDFLVAKLVYKLLNYRFYPR